MTGKWAVTFQIISGKKQYAVYRLRDIHEVDHCGNREYATGYMESLEQAEVIAESLNVDEEDKI